MATLVEFVKDKDWIKKDTEPATESEYGDLKRELEQIGYTLKVCK